MSRALELECPCIHHATSPPALQEQKVGAAGDTHWTCALLSRAKQKAGGLWLLPHLERVPTLSSSFRWHKRPLGKRRQWHPGRWHSLLVSCGYLMAGGGLEPAHPSPRPSPHHQQESPQRGEPVAGCFPEQGWLRMAFSFSFLDRRCLPKGKGLC